jgi:hypothetical protein
MSTQKQTKANRQNAQKSTGPKTAQGKNVVSQNAIKHGIFTDSVIKGENEADYEAFHDKFLAELFPVGMVETMLAERFISLAWRLKRAERMQNQAIDNMIENQIDNPMSKRFNMIKWHAKGVKLGDSRYVIDHLQLGRIASTDWSDSRVLDRMMLYERRIENSMLKMLKELKRFEIMRRIEHGDAEQQYEPSPSLRDEAAARCPAEQKGDLKKQTQYAPAEFGAKSFVKGDYDEKPSGGIGENKAKQSQFKTDMRLTGPVGGEIATALRASQ